METGHPSTRAVNSGSGNLALHVHQILALCEALIIHADRVGRCGKDVRLRPFVCLSVRPQRNSKTKDPKVFKVGIGNGLRI